MRNQKRSAYNVWVRLCRHTNLDGFKKNKRDRAINTFYETEYFEGWDDIEDREHAISIIATETHIIEELKKKLKDALSPDEFKEKWGIYAWGIGCPIVTT